MKILITGSAGFIGFNLAHALLKKKHIVSGIDSYDNYYSKKFKIERNKILKKYKNFKFKKIDITKKQELKKYLKNKNFDIVFHFAAQAGVLYSLKNPKKYKKVNIEGFENLLDNLKGKEIKKIYYASSSSVYGDHKKFPLKENLILKPKNIYAISKVKNEELANKYPNKKTFICGLRFFTVYGEWGRPDMFIFKLLNSYKKNKPFLLNNSGNHYRDFTYIGDVVKILIKLLYVKKFNHKVINICSSQPIKIKSIINFFVKRYSFSKIINVKKNKIEVIKTFGSNNNINKIIGFKQYTNFYRGLNNTIKWYFNNKIFKY
jgi:UDP-glucuronate 4-epimerase